MKNEIRRQLRMLAKKILENDNQKADELSEIKEIALQIYNQTTVLEFLENQTETSLPQTSESGSESESESELAEISTTQQNEEKTVFKDERSSIEIEEVEEVEEIEEIENVEEVEKDPEKDDLQEKEDSTEEIKEFSENSDEVLKEKTPVFKAAMNELEKFAAEFQHMPEFERLIPKEKKAKEEKEEKEEKEQTSVQNQKPAPEKENVFTSEAQPLQKRYEGQKPKSLNDSIHRGLTIGLNDRLAFINHLFEGHTEDYTRVLSQINTLNSFEEAKYFIENQVKPDYKNWENKEEISGRFMVIIEKTFQ